VLRRHASFKSLVVLDDSSIGEVSFRFEEAIMIGIIGIKLRYFEVYVVLIVKNAVYFVD
jgi:hypothetical protein